MEWREWVGQKRVWVCVCVCLHVYASACACEWAVAFGSESQCEHTQMCLNLIRPDEWAAFCGCFQTIKRWWMRERLLLLHCEYTPRLRASRANLMHRYCWGLKRYSIGFQLKHWYTSTCTQTQPINIKSRIYRLYLHILKLVYTWAVGAASINVSHRHHRAQTHSYPILWSFVVEGAKTGITDISGEMAASRNGTNKRE